jgi:hypothetical protein
VTRASWTASRPSFHPRAAWCAAQQLREAAPSCGRILAGAATAALGLAAIGSAQWLELRRHAGPARRWILWTALAWAVGLPFSFAPAPFVDESTPLASHLVLWGCGGLLMAYAMALVTWQGVRRLNVVGEPAQARLAEPRRMLAEQP